MKAMVWKELRECGTWAVLAMVLLGVANIFGYYMSAPSLDPIRLWNIKIVASVVSSAMAGVLLGAVQILPELRRDQWAFLLHRPLTPTGLFAGKALAGILMLSLVVFIPDLVTFYWLRFHLGHEIFSFWYVLTSTFFGVLMAVVFYLAAMIAALREARIFGSRLLSLATALTLAVAVFNIGNAPQWWQILLMWLFWIGILALAAAGCFVARGDVRRMALPSQIGLAITLMTGGAAIVFCVAFFVGAVIFGDRKFAFNDDPMNSSIPRGSILANQRGEVMYVFTHYENESADSRSRSHYWQLKGVTLPEGKPVQLLVDGRQLDTIRAVQKAWNIVSAQLLKNRLAVSHVERGNTTPREIHFAAGRYTRMSEAGDIKTYYDELKHRIVFYSSGKRKIIGYSGPGGYYAVGQTPSAEKAYFAGRLLSNPSSNLFWFSHAVFRVDENGRKVRKIIDSGDGQAIESMVPTGAGDTQRLWIVKHNAIEQYDADGRLLGITPLQGRESESDYTGLINTSTGKNLLWFARVETSWGGEQKLHSAILETTIAGKVLRRFELPVLDMNRNTKAISSTRLLTTIAMPLLRTYDKTSFQPREGDYWMGSIFGFSYLSPNVFVPLFVPLCGVLLNAVMIWFISLRAGLEVRSQLLWLALSVPLGLGAVIGLLSFYAWPVRLACKQCGKKRNIERENCEHCKAQWPRPQRNGTEILTRDFEAYALGPGGRS